MILLMQKKKMMSLLSAAIWKILEVATDPGCLSYKEQSRELGLDSSALYF
jgi:hypothetical protein